MRSTRNYLAVGLLAAIMTLDVSAGVSGFSSGRSSSSLSSSRASTSAYTPPRSSPSVTPSRPAPAAPAYTAPTARPAQPAAAAAPARTSGWGSGTSTTAATATKAAVGATALGGALYAAQASKTAADTHAATEAKKTTPEPTRVTSSASSAASHTASAGAAQAQAAAPVTREIHHYQPAQTVVHDSGSGFLNNWLWFSVGQASASHHRDTVVINNAPAGVPTTAPQSGVVQNSATSTPQLQASAPAGAGRYVNLSPEGGAIPAAPADDKSGPGVLAVLLGLVLVSGIGFGIYKLIAVRKQRIAALTPKHNYSL